MLEALASIVSQHHEVHAILIGDGPLREDLQLQTKELQLDQHMHFLGNQNNVPGLLAASDLFVLPSLWEGLPLVFLESMTAGIPIVANNVDGAGDVVIDGETGYLVTPHNPEQMATYILCLLNNEELCKQMGHVAVQRSRYFSTQRMVEQIESLYKELHFSAHHYTYTSSDLAHP